MRHEAIRLVYPNAVLINGESEAWDEEGNSISIDEALVAEQFTKLQAAEPIRLLREKRNQFLSETDWTQIPDSAFTNEKSAEWKLYRQKLRNLPSGLDTLEKVNAVTWPKKPE